MQGFVPVASAAQRRSRAAVLAALAGVTLLAWIYLLIAARQMNDMKGMMQLRPWMASDFLLMLFMWAVMMVGMMIPSATPMTILYDGVARQAVRHGNPMAPTSVFVTGYLTTWFLFSVAATLVQWALQRAALLSPKMVSTSPLLGAGILSVAGIYQWTSLKNRCLKSCRAPMFFLSDHWREGTRGAFQMGFQYGALCVGCCGPTMFLLFVGGVMNLLWIAAIALFVLVEKVTPFGAYAGRAAGLAMIVLGIVFAARFALVL